MPPQVELSADDDVAGLCRIDHRADREIIRCVVAMRAGELLHRDSRPGKTETRSYRLDMGDDIVVEAGIIQRIGEGACRQSGNARDQIGRRPVDVGRGHGEDFRIHAAP